MGSSISLLLVEATRVDYLYGNIKGRLCRRLDQRAGAEEVRNFLKNQGQTRESQLFREGGST
jgi:hypothetical protein